MDETTDRHGYPVVILAGFTLNAARACRVCADIPECAYSVEIQWDRTAEDNDVPVCARCLRLDWPVSMAHDERVCWALRSALPPGGIDADDYRARVSSHPR